MERISFQLSNMRHTDILTAQPVVRCIIASNVSILAVGVVKVSCYLGTTVYVEHIRMSE